VSIQVFLALTTSSRPAKRDRKSSPCLYLTMATNTPPPRRIHSGAPRHSRTCSSPATARTRGRREASGDRSSSSRVHKRGTSLGLLPVCSSSFNPPTPSSYSHKRTSSASFLETRLGPLRSISPLRNVLSDSPTRASTDNMPIRRAAPYSQTRSSDVVMNSDDADGDRQRGLELVLGLMGNADLVSENEDGRVSTRKTWPR
jgi:hypothetical protein